jgi:hypothetical protein
LTVIGKQSTFVGIDSQFTIAMTEQTACGKRWAVILSSFERNFDDIVKNTPSVLKIFGSSMLA